MSKKIPVPNRDELYKLYFEDNLRLSEVASKYNTTTTTVKSWFRLYKFPKKDKRKALELAYETNLKLFGSKSVLCNKDIQDKIKDANLKKFGCECPLSSKEIRAKINTTVKEKYGVSHIGQVKEVKDAIKETIQKRYGVDNIFKDKEYIQKCISEKYGVKSNLEREDVKDKIKATNLSKYGVDNPFKSKEVQDSIRKHYKEEFGVANNIQIQLSDKAKEVLFDKERLCTLIDSYKIPNSYTIASDLGITPTTLLKYAHKYGLDTKFVSSTSSYEQELCVLFPNTFKKDRTILKPKEIDLYSPEHKIGIEFNGNYWHSDAKKDKYYHQNKSLEAIGKGIFLYHIFEYEWLDERKKLIIISQLKNLLKQNTFYIYARKCIIKEVSSKDSREFLNNNHLQGYCNSKVRLGLYYNDELVSLMTFGKPRFNKKCEWELLRFCNKLNTSVVGGASKLFKHFVDTYKPSNMLSYSNIAKTTGKMYEKLGFENNGVTQPDYVWVKSFTVLSRYQCQVKVLKEQGFDVKVSEDDTMRQRGFFKLYSCGNNIWSIKFKEK